MREIKIPGLGRIKLMGRGESSLDFYPELRGRLIRAEGSPRQFSMFGQSVPRALGLGVLSSRWFPGMAVESEGGILLSRRVVTDAGVTFLANDWEDGADSITDFNAHGNGTGTNAEAVGDVALQTEVETRQAGTKSRPEDWQIRTIATIAQTGTHAITEHGLFDSTTALGSTLWDRSKFAAINVSSGDSIQFTYTLTVTSGG